MLDGKIYSLQMSTVLLYVSTITPSNRSAFAKLLIKISIKASINFFSDGSFQSMRK